MTLSPLATRALSNRYTRASFRTLNIHATRGPIDTIAALRLLRRNVRDVDRHATCATQERVAQELLAYWRKHNAPQPE